MSQQDDSASASGYVSPEEMQRDLAYSFPNLFSGTQSSGSAYRTVSTHKYHKYPCTINYLISGPLASNNQWIARAHAQRVKQSDCPFGTKIARSRILGICVCCKHESIDIGENLVSTRFELLKNYGLLVLQIVHFLLSMPVVYRPHPLYWYVLMQLHMLELSVGDGCQVVTVLFWVQ